MRAVKYVLVTLNILILAAGFGIVSYMDSMINYMDYHFPVIPCILYAAAMIAVPVLISFLCMKSQERTALVERIRAEG